MKFILKALRPLLVVTLLGVAGVTMGLAAAFLYLDPQLPAASTYRDVRLETPLRIHASDGRLIAEFGSRRRIPAPLDEIPPLFVKAVLDTEDKRFYSHAGIDFVTLVRSVVLLVLNPNERTPGGSTITMQLARNLFLTLDRTFQRKFKEMLLAMKLERELTKDEILELYLNVVPFGKRAYGVAAAAEVYYGTTMDQLTLAQMAMLAGVPQRPSAGNPVNGPRWALRRRGTILRNMRDNGSIGQQEYDAAMAAPITARVHALEPQVEAPHAAEWVRDTLYARFGEALYTGGFSVTTSLDGALQNHATAVLRAGLDAFDRRQGYRGALGSGPGLQPVDPATVLAEAIDTPLQRVARVLAVDDESALAELRDGTRIMLELDGIRWARAYVDGIRKGPRVRSVDDVLTAGDVIHVRRSDEPDEPDEPDVPDEQAWSEESEASGTSAAYAGDHADAETPPQRGWELAQLPLVQGALVALDPSDGGLVAMVGGYDFRQYQFNHATQAGRQPGSGIKPFLYAAALDAGLTPASRFNDAPLVFDSDDLEGAYRPKNSSGEFRGPTRLREALYRSVNLVSMRVLLEIGAGRAIDFMAGLGFDTRSFPRSTQLAVGGGTMAITPLEMATAYAVLANGGYRVEPWIIRAVRAGGNPDPIMTARPLIVCEDCDDSGEAPGVGDDMQDSPVDRARRVMDPRINYQINSMLRDVIRRGTGRRARSLQRSDLAGKTGTTNEADVWFNGFSPDLVGVVWVGFPDNRALGTNVFGSNVPLPIWIDFMEQALADVPERTLPEPPGLVTALIDPATGAAVRPGTAAASGAIREVFRYENAPVPPAETPALPPEESIF